jgi:hypothetical protein
MPTPYLIFDQLLRRVDEPYRSAFGRLLAEHGELFRSARGSSHNHQAWPGFRLARLAEAGVTLTEELERAVAFVEGEGGKYSNRERGMSPLAAFCHMCDVASARLWYDFPLERGDPWNGAGRDPA